MKLEELLKQYNIPIAPSGHRHGAEGWVNVDCPYCGKGTRKFHFGFNLNYHNSNCRRCGRHSGPAALAAMTGLPVGQAARLLAQVPRLPGTYTRPTGTLALPAGLGPLERAHITYLRDRGFDVPTLEKLWGIRGIGIAPRLGWRIFIPIYQYGEVVSWTTRAIGGNTGKRYVGAKLTEETVPAKDLLYGEDYCRHGITIHEGPTDVWAVGPGAVATLGQVVTGAQIARMAHYPIRAVCFDNEPEAQRRARALVDALAVFPGETMNVVLSSKDAATSSYLELQQLRTLLGH